MATSILTAHHVRDRGATARAAGVRNHLLALLPEDELGAVLGVAESVNVAAKQLICRRGDEMRFVHFPHDCVISLVTELQDGNSVEAMTVGCDGFAGMAVFHGVSASRLTSIGQISGTAHRIPSPEFRRLLAECQDRKSTRLNSSHVEISYAVFCL